MVTRTAQIINEYGIHCRPSCLIAKAAGQLGCRVTVQTEAGALADASRVLDLLGLALVAGDTVSISCEGEGEGEAAERMAALFAREFDFIR
ncbi:MAG: HPr family phosphocarrier protein [Victivallales bacterium]|jgi:phosphocarrier protein|nr:HPr family phosphocarrier protein [Victivallales bacterium]MBT7162263.1 HPr family phosphocarrier protein [Victivallales bacterium]